MVFDVYVSNYPILYSERKQISEVLQQLHRWFGGPNSMCSAFVAFEIPNTNSQIDLLLLKDNRLIIFELKSYSGTIKADCTSESILWKKDWGGWETTLGIINPYFKAQRDKLVLV